MQFVSLGKVKYLRALGIKELSSSTGFGGGGTLLRVACNVVCPVEFLLRGATPPEATESPAFITISS
jgi:hypothetical protein